MTATEKLARELFTIGESHFCSQLLGWKQDKWEDLGSVECSAWKQIARHVLRREAKLRKAKR